MIDQLNESIKEGSAAYVFKAIQPTFGWDTAVGFLTHCADVQRGDPIGIMNYRLIGADEIDSIQPVKEYLTGLSKDIIGTDMIVTLTTKSDTKYFGKNDVIIWNVLGNSTFTILEDGELTEERFLTPGDLVYIPKEIEYIVKPEEARTFILFSLE
jgi:hypothetical protein